MEEGHKKLSYLQSLTVVLKDADKRENLDESLFDEMGQSMHDISNRLTEDALQWNIIAECFRCLRNSCASCKRNQELIGTNSYPESGCWTSKKLGSRRKLLCASSDFTPFCWYSLDIPTFVNNDYRPTLFSDSLMFSFLHTVVAAVRCATQFLGNAVVAFHDNQLAIWTAFPLCSLLNCADETARKNSCMLVYNCLTSDRLDQLVGCSACDENMVDVTTAVIRHLGISECEWGVYILEKLLAHHAFMHGIFDELDGSQKSVVLDILYRQLEQPIEPGPCVESLQYVCDQFVANTSRILELGKKDTGDVNAVVVMGYLEVLCAATALPHTYPLVKSDTALLESSTTLLHAIELVGKDSSKNAFSLEGKLSAGCEDPDHPTHGLRRNLIRLLGNMCFKNRLNQDKVRELGGVPLIMNHTSIDTRNPYITQWSIFALRNLCEDNAENQAVIRGLNTQGLADNVQLLQEFGVQAEMCDDKIVVRKTDHQGVSPFSVPNTR